jgi:hypothetical protein
MLFSSLASDTFFGEFMTDPKTMAMLQGNVRKGKFEASKFVALAKNATKKRAKGAEAKGGGCSCWWRGKGRRQQDRAGPGVHARGGGEEPKVVGGGQGRAVVAGPRE